MALISIIILAIGLSMDSLVVALTSGAVIGNHLRTNVLKIAGMLAVIQTLLTIFGWMLGSTFVHHIDTYDHWVSFVILFFLGAKVIYENFKKKDDTSSAFNPLDIKVMFSLAVATSIDATAVGLSLSMVDEPILQPAIVIGFVTLLLSSLGVVFGSKVGRRYNRGINFAGGAILIFIACSILLSHTVWAENDGDSYSLQNLNSFFSDWG